MTPAAAAAELLAPEWERVELLGRCAARLREGEPLEREALDRLRSAQERVRHGRNGGNAWCALPPADLGPLELDVLACVVAPEAEPRIAWLFQQLQPGAPEPYPSLALIRELLALDGPELPSLHAAVAEGGPLRRRRLLEPGAPGPFEPIRPARDVAARLLGMRVADAPPPGALRVRTEGSWAELVLPPDRIALLRELLAWVRQRTTVVERWGGRAAGGPVALFSGPPGTGKTFAASVIAADLGWPLYRVDLGLLVSKYVGETEKNLNRLFEAAHGREMVLQFDEADALFGKRGDLRDARDRYANMEVGHLLSRMELHEGPCVLTTNLREHLDPAFARRIHVCVEFPHPDAAARARLWARLLPQRAPRDPDVDPAMLGEAVHLSGGAIRNAALRAAVLAAEEDRPIGLGHVARSIWRELGKEGRDRSRGDLGPLAPHLDEEVPC